MTEVRSLLTSSDQYAPSYTNSTRRSRNKQSSDFVIHEWCEHKMYWFRMSNVSESSQRRCYSRQIHRVLGTATSGCFITPLEINNRSRISLIKITIFITDRCRKVITNSKLRRVLKFQLWIWRKSRRAGQSAGYMHILRRAWSRSSYVTWNTSVVLMSNRNIRNSLWVRICVVMRCHALSCVVMYARTIIPAYGSFHRAK